MSLTNETQAFELNSSNIPRSAGANITVKRSANVSTKTSKSLRPLQREASKGKDEPLSEPSWTFLTNHAHVLILVSQDESIVLREVASRIGITERAVQRIIADLEKARYIEREKIGRQNHYRIASKRPLRHPIESHRSIGDLLTLVGANNRKMS